jgi:phosphohistidine phosphatase
MEVLIIRHAIAADRATSGVSDDERPLTPEGRKKFREAAIGLAAITRRPDVLLTSPLRRARQTAEIAAAAWGRLKPQDLPALATGDIDGLAAALAKLPREAMVALVGHEPHASDLLARLLGGAASERLTFRKGGAALVEVPASLAEGGRLVWYLRPRILRQLKGR